MTEAEDQSGDDGDIEPRALRLLGRREHSRRELQQKLEQRGFSADAVEPVLDRLEQQGWLNDQRFADMYVRQRREIGYGPVRILAELQQRGIDWEPDELLQVAEHQWRSMAREQRARRFGLEGELSWKERGRQGRFLSQRGFTMAQIEHALQATPEAP